jgi:hypothetical protein
MGERHCVGAAVVVRRGIIALHRHGGTDARVRASRFFKGVMSEVARLAGSTHPTFVAALALGTANWLFALAGAVLLTTNVCVSMVSPH